MDMKYLTPGRFSINDSYDKIIFMLEGVLGLGVDGQNWVNVYCLFLK